MRLELIEVAVPLVMTHTKDIGRYVVAALGLKKWEKRSYIVGDRKSWNEVVELLGKLTGMFLPLLSVFCNSSWLIK